ncbi:MAG: hypothetical protein JWO59_1556 [Chloroflexi bacterium]|jgi:hypothetical protein|nr:hypothetical protein [Chloroflexota bacterium]MDB5074172.1 hypothetical protein [Chloroflexota bacterium]
MNQKNEQYPDIIDNEFFVSWDDPDTETVSVGFLERSMVMDFDYAEFLELADAVDKIRDYIKKSRAERSSGSDGVPPSGRH